MEYAITVIQRGNINILGGIITFAGDEIAKLWLWQAPQARLTFPRRIFQSELYEALSWRSK